jgi:hypothetical protein
MIKGFGMINVAASKLFFLFALFSQMRPTPGNPIQKVVEESSVR